MPVRVVVGEDDLLVREGIVRLLSSASEVDVVAACEDYDAILAAIDDQDPDTDGYQDAPDVDGRGDPSRTTPSRQSSRDRRRRQPICRTESGARTIRRGLRPAGLPAQGASPQS